MHILVMSDLHLEFHADGGASFVQSLDPQGVDVLVLAGDIAVGEDLPAALGIFGHTHTTTDIVFGHTRLICNPLGYGGAPQNGRFVERMVVDL